MLKLGDSKIKSLYIGDAKIKKAYIGEDLIFGETKPSRLPEGYTEVEYIHLSGSCGFNTQYFVKPASTRILMDVEIEAYSVSAGGYFFGEYGRYLSTSNTSYYYLSRTSETNFKIMTGRTSGGYNLDVGSISGNRTIIDSNGPEKTVSIGDFISNISNGPQF